MTTPPSTTAPAAPPRTDVPRRTDDASNRRSRDDFERALRQKSNARDEDDSELGADEGKAPAAPSAMAALMTWAAPLPIKPTGGEGGAGGVSLGGEGATGAAMQSALTHTPEVQAPTATPTEAAWEVSLRQPLGVALDLKAQRSGDAGASHGWSLTIGSPVVDASMLARHAPRLNERLMARGLTRDHAHIEESDTQDTR